MHAGAEQEKRGHDAVGRTGRERIGQPAKRGTGNGGDLRRAARDRGGALQRALRRDQRQHRRQRRAFEGAGDPEHEGRDENLRHREQAGIGAPGQKQRRQPFGDLAELHHALALVAVGGMAGHEQQQRGRQELHQPDHAEIEGAAGHVVDLPADGDRPDLAGEARQASRQQKRQERGMPEQIAGADRHQGGHGKAGILLSKRGPWPTALPLLLITP